MQNQSPNHLHPVIRGLEPSAADLVEACSVRWFIKPNEQLLAAGTTATQVILIHSGRVSLEQRGPDGGMREFAVLGGGDLLACPSLFENRPWQYSARATSSVDAQGISVRQLVACAESDPEFGWQISRRLTSALSRQLDEARWNCSEASRLALASQQLALKTICDR